MGRIWESINASNQHMLTHVPNGQIASSQYLSLPHLFLLDSNKISKKAFSHIFFISPNWTSTLPCPGYSMWNPWKGGWTAEIPDGFHGMVDGFHGFSTWIPYLFHTFSIWIPYLFHMESSWNKLLESSIHTHALKFKL